MIRHKYITAITEKPEICTIIYKEKRYKKREDMDSLITGQSESGKAVFANKDFKYLPKRIRQKYIKLGIVPKYVLNGLKQKLK